MEDGSGHRATEMAHRLPQRDYLIAQIRIVKINNGPKNSRSDQALQFPSLRESTSCNRLVRPQQNGKDLRPNSFR